MSTVIVGNRQDFIENTENDYSKSPNLVKKLIEKQIHNESMDYDLDCKPYCIAKYLNPENNTPLQWKLKRFFDYFATILGLIIISPLLIAIAAAIKIDSEGPVLFKQKRVGKNGKEFYIYKFRTMKVNAEQELENLRKLNETNGKMFKIFDDPRVTRVGKFLRKYSLDEFPQLINVLKGEMSLVGTRPPIPSEVETYENWHYVRFGTMPGLTGAWQVNGRSSIKNFDCVVSLEFSYINNWNFLKDIELILKTFPAVLSGDGAA